MKKLFLTAALAVFGILNVHAQQDLSSQEKKIRFGLKTGANYFIFEGDDVQNNDYLLGLSAGAYVNIPIGQHFAIQPELNYTRVGSRQDDILSALPGDSSITSARGVTRLDYITLPVMFKFYPACGLNIEVGPQVGYNIYARNIIKTYGYPAIVTSETKTDIEDNLKDFDFGVNFGLGYELKNTGVNFGARYYLGITSLDDTDADLDIKNSGFSFAIGYSF